MEQQWQNNLDEFRYLITVDTRPLNSKPDDEYIKSITSHLNLKGTVTISEFSKIVSAPYSVSWSGGIFSGKRSNKNWIKQWIYALDFDKGKTTIEDVFNRLQEIGIVPQVWYSTFSDSPELRKFRVVMFLDTPIEDIRMHKLIYYSLFKMFPDVDKHCNDPSRFFLGGKVCKVVHTSPISTSRLIDVLSIYAMTCDSNSLRKIPLDLEYYSGLKSAEKQDILYNKYRNVHFSASETKKNTSGTEGSKEKIDINLARKKIRILDEFLNGTWLYHMQLLGLATNLIHIQGGMKLMKDTMEKFNQEGKTNYSQNNFNILPYVNKVNYFPQPIYKFSPYDEDSELLDIISSTKDIRGFIEILEPINKIELSEAEILLKSKYSHVIRHGEVGKIYLFMLPTALGKTKSLLGTCATIAFPTNALKNEIAQMMEIPYQLSPDSILFENDSLNRKIEYYYTIGLPQKSMEVLHHVGETSNSKLYSENDIVSANQYLKALRTSVSSGDAVLTTHKRALFTPYKHDTLIFDEDPLNSLLEIKELKISDLFALKMMADIPGLQFIIEFLTKSIPTQINKTPTLSIDIDDLIERISSLKMESNIIDFLNSSFFVRDEQSPNSVYYIVHKELPKDKKVIIMSATSPVYIYKKLYGDRIEVIDISDVKQVGKVIQYTNRSCSRNGLNVYVQGISKKVGDTPVLTFKSFQQHFSNPIKDMYFGNCSGYDGMKGKDMAVVGTPHRNNIEYFLTAKVLGIDFKTTDTAMMFQKIEHNGFRFKFNCFVHDELREIQLSLIESDLIQAVGRARTLRTEAQVDVYSNYPLRISKEFHW